MNPVHAVPARSSSTATESSPDETVLDSPGTVLRALPQYYAITGELVPDDDHGPILQQDAMRAWLERFARLLASDVSLIQVRVRQLTPNQLEQVVVACVDLNLTANKRLLLNGPAELVTRYRLAGAHLTSQALLAARKRPLRRDYLVGASCHNPVELAHALRIGCDFACLSPVRLTKGYEDSDVLGLDQFARWVSECNIPVYGLGGLGVEDLGEVVDAGGQGVAGISAFW